MDVNEIKKVQKPATKLVISVKKIIRSRTPIYTCSSYTRLHVVATCSHTQAFQGRH